LKQKAQNAVVHVKKALGMKLNAREEIEVGISNAVEADYGEAMEKAVQQNKNPRASMGERYLAAKRVAELLKGSEKLSSDLASSHIGRGLDELGDLVKQWMHGGPPVVQTPSPEIFGLEAQRRKILGKIAYQQQVLRSHQQADDEMAADETMAEIRGYQAQLNKIDKDLTTVRTTPRADWVTRAKEVAGF
jgi:hypothetical protein